MKSDTNKIHHNLMNNPQGLTRTEISSLFQRHRSAHEIDIAIGKLYSENKAFTIDQKTNGRHAQRWFATEHAKEAEKLIKKMQCPFY